MAQNGHKVQAGVAYTEQTTAKMQMAELENIAPSSESWLDKWGHIEGAVLTHMFEEENGWFIHLKNKGEHQDRLTARYTEEFERYTGVA
jgi:molybdenum cofactor biosynthesis enzyme MoaA